MKNALSKSKQKQEERRARAEERSASISLEPAFPFVVMEFDPDFFDVTGDTPDKLAPES